MSNKQWCTWSSYRASTGPHRLANNHGLPVSPALQPSQPKVVRERQSLDSLTPFRKTVAANPYANALATPVRQCNFTAARLPSHYLLAFCTVFRHGAFPDKAVPYLVPAESSTQTSHSYMFNSSQLLKRLGVKHSWQRLLGHNLKYGLKSRNDYRWPSQINHDILHGLRKVAVAKLAWIFNHQKSALIMPLDFTKECPASACILHLREHDHSSCRSDQSTTEYHLHNLLGAELVAQLVKDTSLADHDALILAQSYMTLSAHTALARLSTFMFSMDTSPHNPKT
jgi:hypothetical protein